MAAPSETPLIWLITGTSTGLGRHLSLAALERGDKVIATARARSLGALQDLEALGAHTLELDVTASLDVLNATMKEAVAVWGRIDVLVNNAGYIAVGALEENTPEETLEQYNTNVFGALNVSRAVLPYMRERKSGTVVFMGSLGGWREVPNAGLYCSTKFAIRGLSETLHAEISPLGLRSICVDFGYFRTSFLATGHRAPQVSKIADYETMTSAGDAALTAYNGKQPGDPAKGVRVILDVAHDTTGKPFPTVLTLGSDCLEVTKAYAQKTVKRLGEWESVSRGTDF